MDAEAIADRLRRSLMENALAEFVALSASGVPLQEADWSKVRGLEFREALGERDRLVGEVGFLEVDVEDPAFAGLVSTEGVLRRVPTDEGIAVSKSAWRAGVAGEDCWVSCCWARVDWD